MAKPPLLVVKFALPVQVKLNFSFCHALILHRNNRKQIVYCNSSRVCTIYCINSLQIDQEAAVIETANLKPEVMTWGEKPKQDVRSALIGSHVRDWPMRNSLTSVFGYHTAKWRQRTGKTNNPRVNIEIFLSLPPTGGIKIIFQVPHPWNRNFLDPPTCRILIIIRSGPPWEF